MNVVAGVLIGLVAALHLSFLALEMAGPVWGLVAWRTDVQVFFLLCVVVAGVYGAAKVSRRILVVQAVPALLALGAAALS